MNPTISPATHLIIKGARQHNLKNIDLVLPKNKLIVFTGLSGSGKSSLAFDTIYAEGQRRYVESLSSYARQFLGIMQKPDVDSIDGLSPSISIDQKTTSRNPRSTVGTITEIYDYLRLLFARIGHPHCPTCGLEIAPQTVDQIRDSVFAHMQKAVVGQKQARFFILSPVVRDKRGEFEGLFANLKKQGYERVRVDGRHYHGTDDLVLIKTNRHSIAVIIDRLSLSSTDFTSAAKVAALKSRLHQSIEQALDLSDGLVIVTTINDSGFDFPEDPHEYTDQQYSQALACPQCGRSFQELEPRLFSFNTPHGACPRCDGLGTLLKIDPQKLIAPELTLSEGAIIPLANAMASDSWYARKLKAVCDAEQVLFTTVYQDLPESFQHLVLYGSQKWYHVSGANRQGRQASFSFQWEGVVHELERRYQETQSDYIRQEFERYMTKEPCPVCHATRLKEEALSVTVLGKNIYDCVSIPINQIQSWINELTHIVNDPADSKLSAAEKVISQGILKEIGSRLEFLLAVGLEYLTLHREAATLAGGEAQRIRLASQIGTGLTGVLYVLDEPTIGLHPRDNHRLIDTLIRLRDLGNTVLVVEHDRQVMEAADVLVDFGPAAGDQGGMVVAQGTFKDVRHAPHSLTGRYLRGAKKITSTSLEKAQTQLPLALKLPASTLKRLTGQITLKGARQHNLKNLDISFPLGKLVVVTGVSGSGKSSLIHDTLYPALKLTLKQKVDEVGEFNDISGASEIARVDLIDQSPIGRTPRSNPATYTKTFDYIRQIFASVKEAKLHGYKPGRFSFNVKGGRCEACQGDGQVKIEMQFLSDVYVTCEVCHGKRYNAETLRVTYQDHTISDILNLSVDQALMIFKNHPCLVKRLSTLKAVGLGYIKLGQPAPTLSGGEAQRVKLAKELSTISPHHTVYLLDEPTTGLHFEDVKNLLVVLKQLVALNNTVIVIEHNLDVIKNADWIIDLGPEGGDRGGQIIATGSPKDLAAVNHSYTGQFLKKTQDV